MRYELSHYAYAYENKDGKVTESNNKPPKGYRGVVDVFMKIKVTYKQLVIYKDGGIEIVLGANHTFQARGKVDKNRVLWNYGTIDGKFGIFYDKSTKEFIEALKYVRGHLKELHIEKEHISEVRKTRGTDDKKKSQDMLKCRIDEAYARGKCKLIEKDNKIIVEFT